MTNHLGELFLARRDLLGWSLGEAARRLCYRNVSKAANKVLRLEREGEVEDRFLPRIAAVLGVDEQAVRDAIRADRVAYERAWSEWADQPTPIRVVTRAVPGFMVEMAVPGDVTTPDAAVAFARYHAARLHKKVFVIFSRRVSVGITESGDINGQFLTRPDTDPCPLVSARRQRFLFRTTGFGAVEPWVPPGGGTT